MDFIDEQRMSRLYEKFILEYFKREHPEIMANASQIPWQLDDDMNAMLPVMQTDIMLMKDEKTLIIDAKYYSSTMQAQYDVHTLHSGNLYQIFTYVKNKECQLSSQPHEVSGVLLYAKTDEGLSVYFVSMSRLLADLSKAAREGRLERRWKVYQRPRLLLIDEIGYSQLDRVSGNLFFQLVCARYENSDQGSHYKSIKFIQLIKDSELRQSMSRKANCWDNAPQESFFGHMKDEIDIRHCQTHEEIKSLIDDWADYYNNDRYQWDLARLSPNEYAQYIKTGVYSLQIPKSKGTDNG